MDLRGLRYFLVAARHLHFGQAAEELGIAQPALSQRIKTLESRVGVKLFDRSKRAVSLTSAGKVFVGEAQRLVNESERAMRVAKAAEEGTAGELHIGYGGSVIFEPKICNLLQNFRDTYPDVSVLMHECKVEDQLDGIKAGRLDISLIWGPIGPGYPELRHLTFSRASMSVVLRRDHPLADKERIGLPEIAGEAFIALMDPPGRGIAHVVDEMFAAADLSPQIALRVSSLISVFGLAGAGIGIGIVPTLPIEIISPAFVQRPLADVGDCNEILISATKRNACNASKNFLEMARRLAVP